MRLLDDPLTAVLLLLLVSFAAPVLFLVRLRNAERHRPEPWTALAKAFLWGCVPAALLAIVLELQLAHLFPGEAFPGMPLALLVLAPVVEEAAKVAGLVFVRERDPEPEDGFIYGGAAGLGFAATENVFYVSTAFLLGGLEMAGPTAAYRGVVTVMLHGGASALAGGGLWQARHAGRPMAFVVALLGAIVLHASYNGIASQEPLAAAVGAGALAILAWWRIRQRVIELDRAGA